MRTATSSHWSADSSRCGWKDGTVDAVRTAVQCNRVTRSGRVTSTSRPDVSADVRWQRTTCRPPRHREVAVESRRGTRGRWRQQERRDRRRVDGSADDCRSDDSGPVAASPPPFTCSPLSVVGPISHCRCAARGDARDTFARRVEACRANR